MIQDVVIKNPDKLETLIDKFKKDGKDKFFIVSDFDRTLTRMFVGEQKMVTVIGQIRNGEYLSPEYIRQAHALYDKYYPYEIDPNLSRQERSAKMSEWWREHFKLLIESGFSKQVIAEIINKKSLRFRDGAFELLEQLNEYQIPLIILSAAPGDMLNEYLVIDKIDFKNIYVIADFLEYDENGKAIAVKEPVIHSANKNEINIYDFPAGRAITGRSNVIVIGDSLDDLDVLEKLKFDNLITIGFLHPNLENQLELYKEKFDVVLTGDPSMRYVNDLINKITE